jgi:F-type H+-transporting ATPase subunit b
MPQFDSSTFAPQIFWLIVCFGFLFTLMAWVLIPRLSKVIEVRETRIQEDLARAQNLLEEVGALRKEAQDRLYTVRHASREKYQEAIEAIQHEKTVQLHNLQEQTVGKLAKFYQSLLDERQEFTKGLEEAISQSVITVSPSLLGVKPSQSSLSPLIKSALKERNS